MAQTPARLGWAGEGVLWSFLGPGNLRGLSGCARRNCLRPVPEERHAKGRILSSPFLPIHQKYPHEEFEVVRAAKLEVNWWIVHRKLFGNPENQELVEALKSLYAEAYGVEPAKVQEAARQRAAGMLYSDLWVNAGKPAGSQLLVQEEEALAQSYASLKEAIQG
ncbi:MAG: hypothetical protein ABSB41_03055 [Anaerolineales bacterium]